MALKSQKQIVPPVSIDACHIPVFRLFRAEDDGARTGPDIRATHSMRIVKADDLFYLTIFL